MLILAAFAAIPLALLVALVRAERPTRTVRPYCYDFRVTPDAPRGTLVPVWTRAQYLALTAARAEWAQYIAKRPVG